MKKKIIFIISYFNNDKESKAKLPEIVASTPVPIIPLSVEFTRFKNDSNTVNLETYMGIPIKDVKKRN